MPECNTHEYEIATIGDVVKDVHYGTAKKASEDGRYIYIRMNNITYDGELDLTDIKRIDVPEKDIAGCMVQEGDVLFNRTNSKDLVGKTCHFTGNEPMIIAGYIIRLRMNGKVLPEYISTFMNLDRSKKMLYSMAKGAVGQANINAKEVQSIPIVIPPENVQQEFLKLRKQSDKSKFACLKSQFIEMFNGKGYPEKQLSEVCKKITDGAHKTPKYLGEGVTFISAKNIINGRLDFSDIKYISESEYQEIQKRCQTEKGDVLLAKSGSLGMTAIVENDESLGLFESLAILKYDRMLLNGVFLCRQMQSDAVQSQLMSNVKGVAVKHLHLNVISKTKIIVPPMDLQERFCAFARQSDKSK